MTSRNAHHPSSSLLAQNSAQLGAANNQSLTSILSVSVEEAGLTNIAECTLRNMWAKAEKLVSTDRHILKVPWSKDPKARMVKSLTSDQPHLVTRNPKNMNLFCCDKCCPMFKGFSICSHMIASAHDNGCLRSFLDQLSGVCHPNLTAIANHGMPVGVGRKGGVAKYKRKRKHPTVETQSVCQCISDSQLPAVAAATNTANGPCTSSTLRPSSSQPPANPLDFNALLSTLHPVCSNTSATATSQGQVFVGSSIVNLAPAQVSLPTVPSVSTTPLFSSGFSSMHGQLDVAKKPFILRFKNISDCQVTVEQLPGVVPQHVFQVVIQPTHPLILCSYTYIFIHLYILSLFIHYIQPLIHLYIHIHY